MKNFRVYQDSLALAKQVAPVIAALKKKDNNLADQLRRALISVPLNLAEGAGQAGGHRKQRYLTALGSLREVEACVRVAEAMGYLRPDAEMTRCLDKAMVGTLRLCQYHGC